MEKHIFLGLTYSDAVSAVSDLKTAGWNASVCPQGFDVITDNLPALREFIGERLFRYYAGQNKSVYG